MAFSIAEAVLKKLAPLAAEQVGLLWGLKGEILKLKATVSSIQAVLLDAEEQSSHNHQVRHWLGELKGVLYDADDLLDDVATEALRKQKMDGNFATKEARLFFSDSNQLAYGLKMAHQIKAIRSKLELIAQNREQFKFETRPLEPPVAIRDWRQTDSSLPDAVVGREADREEMIEMLRSSSYEDKVAVIPIIGIGGLGKTTLAQLVYNDCVMKSHFEVRVWVCVSENFDPKLLVKMVLESVTKKKAEDHAMETLKELLREAVQNKQLLGIDSKENGIMATLRLSYDNLPSKLKQCFAYCALFPKDHKIEVKTLVQLWMAQGYIESSQSSFLDDVGVDCFKNLLWRSFFQDVTKDGSGNIKYCKMHDLMHDLAMEVADKGTILMLNVSNSSSVDWDLGRQATDLERVQHISLDDSAEPWSRDWRLPTSLARATKLRTFMNLAQRRLNWKEGEDETILTKMIGMRVLSPNINERNIIRSINIRKLKHLRYLHLSVHGLTRLPEEITSLVNLQVLKLQFAGDLQRLPSGFGKLSNLMYLELDLDWGLECMPVGIGHLCSLRELPLFVLGEATDSGAARISELKHLNSLGGGLRITRLERVEDEFEAVAASLKDKKHLQSLVLEWTRSEGDTTDENAVGDERLLEALRPHRNLKVLVLRGYHGRRLPSWFSSLNNLVEISIFDCPKLQSLPPLDPLVSLEELTLELLESLRYICIGKTPPQPLPSSSSSNDSHLPSLKSLRISNCSNLIGWSQTTELPQSLCLSDIHISHCPKMISMPSLSAEIGSIELSSTRSELLDDLVASLPSVHSQFKSLELSSIEGLRVMPQGLLPHLASLESLTISCCDELTTLPPSMFQQLTSLQTLQIYSCSSLEMEDYDYDDDDENQMMFALPRLHSVLFNNVPKLVCLPEWLRHFSNLQQLKIVFCDLKLLPEWLTKLTNLDSLELYECGDASGRCRGITAEDWPNIAHIPNISIEGMDFQHNGCYFEDEEEEEEEEKEYDDDDDDDEKEEEDEEPTLETLADCIARQTRGLFQRCFFC